MPRGPRISHVAYSTAVVRHADSYQYAMDDGVIDLSETVATAGPIVRQPSSRRCSVMAVCKKTGAATF